MAKANSTPTGTAVTRQEPIAFLTGDNGQSFFSVNAGVPILAALEQASNYLSTAKRLSNEVVGNNDAEHAGAVDHLLELGLGIVQSVIGGLMEAGHD